MEHAEDRREFTRVPFATDTIIRADGRVIKSANSLDVSLNGMRLATQDLAPEEETVCEVEIALSGSEPPIVISGRGTIVRSTPGTVAIHFIEIDLDSYHHLQQLILNNTEHPERAEQEFNSHIGIRKPPAPS